MFNLIDSASGDKADFWLDLTAALEAVRKRARSR